MNLWRSVLRTAPSATRLLLVTLMFTACSGLSVEAARQLATTGRQAAAQAKQTSIVSEQDYARALDAEAFFHGSAGNTDMLKDIVSGYDQVRGELLSRAVVFDRLADLYDAFGDLAGINAARDVETALGNLDGAVRDYARQMKLTVPVSTDATNAIATIGGLLAAEIQKAKLKKASALIAGEIEKFHALLADPLVRTQVTSFNKLLQKDAAVAVILLWDKGALEPTPLLNDMGRPAGLGAVKDSEKVVASNESLRMGLHEVLEQRLRRQADLIDQGYAASLRALDRLGQEHKKLEQDQPLDLARLREVVAQLRTIVELLTRVRAGLPS
jgi:hypothetical protein